MTVLCGQPTRPHYQWRRIWRRGAEPPPPGYDPASPDSDARLRPAIRSTPLAAGYGAAAPQPSPQPPQHPAAKNGLSSASGLACPVLYPQDSVWCGSIRFCPLPAATRPALPPVCRAMIRNACRSASAMPADVLAFCQRPASPCPSRQTRRTSASPPIRSAQVTREAAQGAKLRSPGSAGPASQTRRQRFCRPGHAGTVDAARAPGRRTKSAPPAAPSANRASAGSEVAPVRRMIAARWFSTVRWLIFRSAAMFLLG